MVQYDAAMGTPVVQIYTMQSVDEAIAIADLGVDHVGVTPASRGLPGEITVDVAADICEVLGDRTTTVALSVEVDADSILAMVKRVRPDILHLCAAPGAVPPATVADIRRRSGGIPVMHAIAVTDRSSIDEAVAFAAVSDYLILDSVDPTIEGIGAAGTTHDWDISATIVRAVDIPVILAGGLSPTNVQAAVAAVEPWGVDSLTHTNRAVPGGGFRKDVGKVSEFLAAARSRSGGGEGQ